MLTAVEEVVVLALTYCRVVQANLLVEQRAVGEGQCHGPAERVAMLSLDLAEEVLEISNQAGGQHRMAEENLREMSDHRKAGMLPDPGTAPSEDEKELGSDEQVATPRRAAADAVGAAGIYNSLAPGRWWLRVGMPCLLAEGSDAASEVMQCSLVSTGAFRRAEAGHYRRTYNSLSCSQGAARVQQAASDQGGPAIQSQEWALRWAVGCWSTHSPGWAVAEDRHSAGT